MVQETRNKKQETRNKKQETRNKTPYGPPEWVIARLSLVMPVLSKAGAYTENMDIQGDDDEWN